MGTPAGTPTGLLDAGDVLPATVGRTVWRSRNYVSVFVTGEALRSFPVLGYDQAFRFFFPRPGRPLVLPAPHPDGWYAAFTAMPEDDQPTVRNYTVRRFDPQVPELEIEFVVHGDDPGSASTWAARCTPGDRIGIRAEGCRYQASARPGRQLIVGDDTAVPAVLAILESGPSDLDADVWVEVPTVDDIRDLPEPGPSVRMHWMHRDGGGVPGAATLAALGELSRPEPLPVYAFVAGESELATGLRRHLVRNWGMAKDDIDFVGYWSRAVSG